MASPEVHAGSRNQDGERVAPVAGGEQFLKGVPAEIRGRRLFAERHLLRPGGDTYEDRRG